MSGQAYLMHSNKFTHKRDHKQTILQGIWQELSCRQDTEMVEELGFFFFPYCVNNWISVICLGGLVSTCRVLTGILQWSILDLVQFPSNIFIVTWMKVIKSKSIDFLMTQSWEVCRDMAMKVHEGGKNNNLLLLPPWFGTVLNFLPVWSVSPYIMPGQLAL